MSFKSLKLLTILFSIFMLIGCASKAPAPVEGGIDFEKNEPKEPAIKSSAQCPDVYIVKEGETLFSISLKCGFNYKEVANANGLKTPYKVKKGDEIRLDLLRKQDPAKIEPAPSQEDAVETIPLNDGSTLDTIETVEEFQGYGSPTEISEPKVIREVYNNKNFKETEKFIAQKEKLSKTWAWPTEGKIISEFNPDNGKKGLEILGEMGQEIRTVSRGKVIYAGEDLKGYGKLIIIKHDDDLITVYGNAQEILVSEGQTVEAAEAIATMGSSASANEAKLIFEVRKGGQSIDPMKFLKRNS